MRHEHVHAWAARGLAEHRLDEEARGLVGARHARERGRLDDEVSHHALVAEPLPVRPRASSVEDEHAGVAEEPIGNDGEGNTGSFRQGLRGLDAAQERARVERTEPATEEAPQLEREPAPDVGDREDVARITWRQVVTDAVPKQHDDGAVGRRSLEEALHRGRDLPLHRRHDATPTMTDGSAGSFRTAASSNPAAESSRPKCSAERSRPPVAMSRCRSHSAPATLSSGTSISTT